jgi:hypothetical protein
MAACCQALALHQVTYMMYEYFNWEQWWVIDLGSTTHLQKEH